MSLDVQVSAAGVAGAAASDPDESERAALDDNGIMSSASNAGVSAGAQFDMVASSRLIRSPFVDVMMGIRAMADAPAGLRRMRPQCDEVGGAAWQPRAANAGRSEQTEKRAQR